MTPLDVDSLRTRFPALGRTLNGRPVAYLDGPGGTQVPDSVIDAMTGMLRAGVSNLHGGFASSDLADATLDGARRAVADLFGADPEEIVFGQNMTSLTFSLSRALARTWQAGDEIVVTRLDHDANISPWRLAAADRNAAVRVADFDPETGMLDVEHLESLLTPRTRLVAVTMASNALGSMPPLRRIIAAAHEAGALVAVDAVHGTPHRTVDVRGLDCDVLTASAYKFFGPHTGVQFIRSDLLDAAEAYRVAPAPAAGPGKWESGTQSFESLAGLTAAVDYLAGLGTGEGRRPRLLDAMGRIAAHEADLAGRFLRGAAGIGGLRVYGVRDPELLEWRTPTFAVSVAGRHPDEVAAILAARGIFTWSGHYYAVEAMRHLGVLDEGGLVRIGFVHYTTRNEVDRVLDDLAAIAAGSLGQVS